MGSFRRPLAVGAWVGALLWRSAHRCLAWRTDVEPAALLRGQPHRCLGRGVLQRGRYTAGAGALLQFTMRPPSSLLLALQRALRRARRCHCLLSTPAAADDKAPATFATCYDTEQKVETERIYVELL